MLESQDDIFFRKYFQNKPHTISKQLHSKSRKHMAIKRLVESAVPEALLSLIKALMRDERLDRFYLVGGTSLALRIGHRISVDIDLFTNEDFEADSIGESLQRGYSATSIEKEKNTVRAVISNINVDLIAHRHQLLESIEQIGDIRMAGLKDIAAMKINAISNRGAKKDFWDYAALLSYFSAEEMLSFYEAKYPSANAWHAEKSLSFFDDAEYEPDPRDLSGRTWSEIKRIISRSLKM